jgi:tRNA-Thr(GGU) m(6)t(6)A37 methyltransferase TsaA
MIERDFPPDNPEILVRPIGRIRTPFSAATGTPIQSSVANGAEGAVEVFPEFVDGLRDIAGFERLWLVYYFHRACSPQLIVRPYLDAVERGVFATRSPARPNRIGISTVRLLAVEGNRLRIADVDMLDQTPLLDIKPYVPVFDLFEVSQIGWYANKSARGAVADDRFEGKGPKE